MQRDKFPMPRCWGDRATCSSSMCESEVSSIYPFKRFLDHQENHHGIFQLNISSTFLVEDAGTEKHRFRKVILVQVVIL